jgi:hypothetical protein
VEWSLVRTQLPESQTIELVFLTNSIGFDASAFAVLSFSKIEYGGGGASKN